MTALCFSDSSPNIKSFRETTTIKPNSYQYSLLQKIKFCLQLLGMEISRNRASVCKRLPRIKSLRLLTSVAIIVIISLGTLVYLPGLSGPYVFDDYSNLLKNDFIKIKVLSAESLKNAAFSLQAGPLRRPLAMASFALNYYFAGGFSNPLYFKVSNLVIHLVNGLLVFWLSHLVLLRLSCAQTRICGWLNDLDTHKRIVIAALCALLWVLHPMQLTTVLYVVQRMTELSALFTLFGLVCYLKGRVALLTGNKIGYGLIAIGVFGSGTLGAFSKENAVLLPIFILAFEGILFKQEAPWRYWYSLSSRTKLLMSLTAAIGLAVIIFYVIQYALGGYTTRDFTIIERTLTQPRVVLFYIAQILIPRIHVFGLYHDDIALSTTLFTPWTTLPAIIIILGIMVAAVLMRRHLPFASLGLFLFFIGHSLESTIFDLEIAHEHRNYLPALGIIFVIVDLVLTLHKRYKYKLIPTFLPILLILYGGTTLIRSNQWSDYYTLMYIEALHHPNSPRTLSDYGVTLYLLGKFKASYKASLRASQLNPNEPGYFINLHLVADKAKIPLPPEIQQATLAALRKTSNSTLLHNALYAVHTCILSSCRNMNKHMELWLRTLMRKKDSGLYDYMLARTLSSQGRNQAAIRHYNLSHQKDPIYLHPLFDLAYLYLRIGDINSAIKTLSRLKKANINNPYPRSSEIRAIKQTIINRMRKIK